MIKYHSSHFGLSQLVPWHGSAVWRAFVPSCFSTAVLAAFGAAKGEVDQFGPSIQNRWLVHPYPMTSFVAFFAFLIVFRLNFAYQRYWEAATEIHKMTSKWLDSAICIASFHYQCHQYDDIRPLTFGKHPNLTNVTRERERQREQTLQGTKDLIEQENKRRKKKKLNILQRVLGKKDKHSDVAALPRANPPSYKTFAPVRPRRRSTNKYFSHPDAKRWISEESTSRMIERPSMQLHAEAAEIPIPSQFLQEAAHLYSLLSAVAMSTLRNDVEGVPSPLKAYKLGQPFPPVNPDKLSADIKHEYSNNSPIRSFFYFIFGMNRSSARRTMYNAARPFTVLGGISDAETKLLQEAQGPYAQMALVNMWLKEFISREYLHGSTGDVPPPIISRLYQFISDGVVGYNQCRKIAFVPFPFVHAQVTVFFTLVMLFACPVIFWSFVNDVYFACVMNFVTVLCFCGSHEVARELENPYCTVPNDLPLNNFQAQFNESLLSMYAGFHPDSWHTVDDASTQRSTRSLDSYAIASSTLNDAAIMEDIDESEREATKDPHSSSMDQSSALPIVGVASE